MPGYVTTQKVITVSNDDESMNAAISEQNADGWVAVFIVAVNTDVIILFSKSVPAT